MEDNGISGVFLYNEKITDTYKENSILLIKQKESWEKAKMTDSQNFQKIIANKLKDKYNKLNNIVGYISFLKKQIIYI